MTAKSAHSEGAVTDNLPRRILHLEDNEHDRELLQHTLKSKGLVCEFVHATGQSDFEAALSRSTFDLIISDFSLPAYNGMAALTAARAMQPETPFLFVSGTIGEERAVESLISGATDYILKTHLARLVPAIERALRDAKERKARKELEGQLRQSQKMEAIGQLAGGVAHDFNNLLAVIQGNVELVLMCDTKLEKESRESLKQVTIAAERAANLTRQLLAFGRKQSIQTRAVKLSEVVSNLAKMLKRVIGTNITMESTSTAPELFVQADVGMIEQVLLNLVVNARDAMPQGGRLVITTERVLIDEAHAQIRPEARPGEFACLAVSDTGTGIPPEHLPHIFEPFYTTKEVGKGTGLGLATVHGIVKQHQGWVEVSTRAAAGTTFKIYLPALPAGTGVGVASPHEAALPGGTERILLAEDDAALRVLTRRILETFGYEVFEAASGAEALELATTATAPMDLLLTNIVMPDGVLGRDLAQQMRMRRPELRVIFASGHNRDAAGKPSDFCNREADIFLQKPYPLQMLVNTVRQCLDQRAAG